MTHDYVDVTLVITSYNRAPFIDRAIRSCLAQITQRRRVEVLIVDDHSTDESLEIIGEFHDEVRLLVNPTNRGVAGSSNVALGAARGKYWMRVDADDFLNAYACAFMAALLDENPEYAFVYCDHFRVDQRGRKIDKVRLNTDAVLFNHGAGILFRTETLRQIGGYDDELRSCEDYDLLLRLRRHGARGYYLPLPLYRYYIHGKNMTLDEDREKFRKIVELKHGL
ncbi:MAG: glycosyltransferase [Alphaproteobacteria bacterium]|nr:glycosyltransferase [Alphaproteobacteria bacterium]